MGVSANKAPAAVQRWIPAWWAVFLIGLVLWLATIGVASLTGDLIILPTIVLLGSFLVPVTAVVWYLDHDSSPELAPRRIVSAFLIAGVLGVLGASVLEYYLISVGLLGNLEVGLIEEFVKAVLIVLTAWGIRSFHLRDGMVLGATVGFGFAALESSGYALASLFVVYQHRLVLSLDSVVVTELIRGILAPFGHGAWSAIVGGAMFAAARARGRIGLSRGIIGAFVLVVLLHAVFDSVSRIDGYVVIAVVGTVPLVLMWRRGRREDLASPSSYFR
ncbi:MAG: PrsW family intramembrane metalloprotease [Chloroflexi bacterium]|nr:MAG: PrsW family intramembrane metalloprotease [Chloroflexota bacterium]TME48728.1 MAG: PrsW family intramembrane metalloprotease [Chloroflexota bacterium]